MKNSFLPSLLLLIVMSCSPKQYNAIILPETDYVELDTLVVSAPKTTYDTTAPKVVNNTLPRYNPSAKREIDLIHTKLDLRFDWEKEQVLGKAYLTLKPFFYPLNKVKLDAKGFEFHHISFEGSKSPLTYIYDGQQVIIDLGKSFDRKEEIKLFIDYTATPRGETRHGAITSDKGLFFINPLKKDADKPQQIWTQGQTENNSRWFPTIDKPNERCTQEMYLTVEDKFKTLSNGVLVSSKKNPDGTRTDYWKMDMPHTPYLFMIAVGEYAVVRDLWRGKPVDYYVEPKFEPHARAIFPHTPEMLSFFSDKLGFEYPWQKYAQVVVRDYVSGAMENTTAVIFGEFMQRTAGELVDDLTNDKIVAHEMFHHWFGNYVTCESWANLTMNEGFANYSEYLWLEYKHGREEADLHRYQELQGYLESTASGTHPLIHFGYDDKEDMFDAHSYNKGGLVLHMLRLYVGDEAFFESLNRFLKKHAFTEVEAHELRLIFEDVTGEDLNWFFDQWFFNEGHPELNVSYDYDDENQEVIVDVEQIQNPDVMPGIFVLPVGIDIYSNGTVSRQNILINERKQQFRLKYEEDPDLIVFDGDGIILGIINDQKSNQEYVYQFRNSANVMHRLEALGKLAESDDENVQNLFKEAFEDSFWLMRMLAVNVSEVDDDNGAIIERLLVNDPNVNVRQASALKIAESGDDKYVSALTKSVSSDPAIMVVSASLEALLQIDQEAAFKAADNLKNSDDESVILTLSNLYASSGDPEKMQWFAQNFNKVSGYSQYAFIENYAELAQNAGVKSILQAAELFKEVAMNEAKLFWLRFLATKSINDLHAELANRFKEEQDALVKEELNMTDLKLKDMIKEILAWEKEAQVLDLYRSRNYPDPK